MKFSKLEELVRSYNDVLYSDEMTEVKPGCDCGCGGEFYLDNDNWDQMVKFNRNTINEIKEFCNEYGIEYDGIYADTDL